MSRLKCHHVKSGDELEFKAGEIFYMACCDCQLIHRVATWPGRGKVYLRIWRDNRMTNIERRKQA